MLKAVSLIVFATVAIKDPNRKLLVADFGNVVCWGGVMFMLLELAHMADGTQFVGWGGEASIL